MITRKKLANELADLNYLQTVIEAYEEIASFRMRRVKTTVLKNREFLSGLNDIFARVRVSYEQEIAEVSKRTDSEVLTKQDKEAAIFLSANTGFYGTLILDTFQLFSEYVGSRQVDPVVIGKVGRSLYEASSLPKPYHYLDLTDSITTLEETADIIKTVANYANVTVFHGKFRDVLHQIPTMTPLNWESEAPQLVQQEKIECIFEPSLEEILEFFEKEILSALFEQTLYESNLSKYTARMVSLDNASSNILDSLEETRLRKRKMHHLEYNKKQASSLVSIVYGKHA